ncbi:alanine racemase [Bacteroidota bacterium]
MAELVVKSTKIIQNIKKLNDYLGKYNVHWTLILKLLSGQKQILERILSSDEIKKLHSIGDSRVSNLKTIKKIRPDIVTMYIKPPSIESAKSIVQYSDISFNTSFETIKKLNDEAKKQGKMHQIVIMIELGELREGIIRENVIEFYKEIFELENIRTVGIGSNLGCMYGVEPTYDKLVQLSLYKRIIEAMFNQKMEIISGGSSITLPLIGRKKLPKSINHFRIGEAAFLGLTPMTGKKFRNLSTDAFEFKANIIELEEKENIPDGNISEGNVGHAAEIEQDSQSKKSYKAIFDFGVLDVDVNELTPKDKKVKFIGTTSDLTVYNLGSNQKINKKFKYKVGDKLSFHPSYMGVARLMNSKFVEKICR